MPANRVIRIDDQVWYEIKNLATPLEDTPNSVLRRVFGLPETKDTDPDGKDPRVSGLLQLVGELVGQTPQAYLGELGYALLSDQDTVLAYIRPRKGRLVVGASKESATKFGINGWDDEYESSRMFRSPSVRWYVLDGDTGSIDRAATVLARLWRRDVPTKNSPLTGASVFQKGSVLRHTNS